VPSHTVRIAAPAADVYARIADPRRRSEWLPELDGTSDVPERPLQEGDAFIGYPVLLGHRLVGRSSVVAADHDACRLEERVVVGASFRTAWTVAEVDGGCVVTQEIAFDFPRGAVGRVERWVLDRYAARMQRAGLERLARTAAASRASGSAPRQRWRWSLRR
jgi:hypothetical protein